MSAVTALPDDCASARSPRKSALGFSTGINPSCVMRKTPISSTEPNRFLVARSTRWSAVFSPSKYSTVSTMCSSVLGPAMPPPLVTCPTTKTAVPLSLAKRMSRAAHSRTCPTLPGAPSRSPVKHVWMESTIITAGRCSAAVARMDSRFVSPMSETSSDPPPSRSARSFTCSGDSSPLTYSVAWPADSRRAATCSRMVDLPMPGSPPTSTMEPGTTPPPSTKSNSARPVRRRWLSVPTTSRRRGVACTAPPWPKPPAPAARRAFLEVAAGVMISSTSVFHSPQASHLPCHLEWSAPHSVQR